MIRLEHLTKEYDVPPPRRGAPSEGHSDGRIVAADHLSLEIAAGEIFGLIGPNGAGKTTALKMICGLLVPTAGRVLVHGVDVERHPEEAQRYIGYLADFFAVYDDLRVWEYLDFFAHAYKMDPAAIPGRVDLVIAAMGLEVKGDAFIHGLSRGMKQRLGIARAIIHDPPVLVLDEPASGLDPKARHDLKQLLRQLNRAGKTIFITSHILSDLEEICSSVGILEKGHLLSVGPLAQVLAAGTEPSAAGVQQRDIRLRLAAPGFALLEWLGSRPGVSGVTLVPASPDTSVQFVLAGGDAELSELLKAMVHAGASVCEVEVVTKTLEEVYSRLATGEVM